MHININRYIFLFLASKKKTKKMVLGEADPAPWAQPLNRRGFSAVHIEPKAFNQDSPLITRFKTSESNELPEIPSGWDQNYIQLKRGRFEWEITLIQLQQIQIFEAAYEGAILDRGGIQSGSCAIRIPQNLSDGGFSLGQAIPPNACLIGREYEYRSDISYRVIVLNAPIDAVLGCAESMQRPLTEAQLVSNGILIPNVKALQQLNAYLNELIVFAKSQPEFLTRQTGDFSVLADQCLITDALPLWVDVLTSKPSTLIPENNSNRRQLVKQAEAFMRDRIAAQITLADLCQELHTSQRNLYYAFQECLGLPPMDYLKMVRLNGVHRALKSAAPNDKVYEIAGRWGFWHMGQFSRDYKAMFDEPPSKTLRRNR